MSELKRGMRRWLLVLGDVPLASWLLALIALGLAGGVGTLVYLNFFAKPAPGEQPPRVTAPGAPQPGGADQPSPGQLQPLRQLVDEPAPAAGPARALPGPLVEARLLFAEQDSDALVSERMQMALSALPAQRARQVLEALASGSRRGHLPTLPPGTRVRDVYDSGEGVMLVDLSREVRDQHLGGSSEELRTVYAIVGTVLANVPQARSVRILVEGREQTTLNGHVDIRRPLQMDLSGLLP